jgi:hypothetical protein
MCSVEHKNMNVATMQGLYSGFHLMSTISEVSKEPKSGTTQIDLKHA